LNPQSPAP